MVTSSWLNLSHPVVSRSNVTAMRRGSGKPSLFPLPLWLCNAWIQLKGDENQEAVRTGRS